VKSRLRSSDRPLPRGFNWPNTNVPIGNHSVVVVVDSDDDDDDDDDDDNDDDDDDSITGNCGDVAMMMLIMLSMI